jgi:hypothetical protein
VNEDGVAVLRMHEDDPLPREALEAVAPKGVSVGRSVLRVELGSGWRERLRLTLELVADAKRAQGADAVN